MSDFGIGSSSLSQSYVRSCSTGNLFLWMCYILISIVWADLELRGCSHTLLFIILFYSWTTLSYKVMLQIILMGILFYWLCYIHCIVCTDSRSLGCSNTHLYYLMRVFSLVLSSSMELIFLSTTFSFRVLWLWNIDILIYWQESMKQTYQRALKTATDFGYLKESPE